MKGLLFERRNRLKEEFEGVAVTLFLILVICSGQIFYKQRNGFEILNRVYAATDSRSASEPIFRRLAILRDKDFGPP